MTDLDGAVVIVTGGARGIGAATATLFAEAGARVVVGDILDDAADELAAASGGRITAVHLDVTDEAQWAETIDCAEAIGPLRVLVNNAGITASHPIELTPLEAFERIMAVNLTGQFLGIRAVVPALRRAGDGAIVNVSSIAGLKGSFRHAAYTASKWGVRGLTKAVALELAHDGIRVNSIHPGFTRTAMTEGTDRARLRTQPIARIAEPEDVARMIVWVARDATFSTGAEFLVEGGQLLGPIPITD